MKKIASIIFAMFMGIALAIGGGVLLSGCGQEKYPKKSSVSVEDGCDNNMAEGEATLPTRNSFNFNTKGGTIAKPRTYQIGDISLFNFGYGFEVNSKGWLESQNKGVSNSYAMIGIRFSSNTSASSFTIRYISYGESNFDYAIFSNLDTELKNSSTADTSNVYKSAKGESSAAEKTVTYSNISSGTHYVYVKFVKDGSVNSYNDSVQLFFESDILSNSNAKYHFKDMMYGTLPTATRTGYEFKGWYINADDNMVPPLSQWTLSGGATYDSSTGAVYLPNSDSSISSPYIYVGGTNINTDLIFHVYADFMCPTSSSSTTGNMFHSTTGYYNSNKGHYSGNGWASRSQVGVWSSLGYTMSDPEYIGAGDCQYIKINFIRSDSHAANPYYIKNIRMIVPGSEGCKVTENSIVESFTPLYAHWEPNPYDVTLNANGGNMYMPLSDWTLSGGATYNASTGEFYLPNDGDIVESPLIYIGDTGINTTKYCKISGEFYCAYSAPGDMFTGGAYYYNVNQERYASNGWGSKGTVGVWNTFTFDMGHGDQYIGQQDCYYIRLQFNRNQTYAPNPYYIRNIRFWVSDEKEENKVSKNVKYNQTYGTLPTPTRENYTFGGWKKGRNLTRWSECEYSAMNRGEAGDNYNHSSFNTENLKPGATYHLRIKKAEVTEVLSGFSRPSQFTVLLYDYTLNRDFGDWVLNFGENNYLKCTLPSDVVASHELALLVYSGLSGQTRGIGSRFTGISVVEETETIVDSSSTFSTLGNSEILFAKWTPVSIQNEVHLRVIGKNGSYSNVDNNAGGTVDVSRFVISGTTSSEITTTQTAAVNAYGVHKAQDFKLTAHAKSGYVFAGFSTSDSPSDAIKNPSISPNISVTYNPNFWTHYYVYFKQVSGNQLHYDATNKYFYFEDGEYPQSYAGTWSGMQSSLTATGETIEFVDPTGRNSSVSVYRNSSGIRYARVVAPKTCTLNLKNQAGTSSSNVSFTAGVSYVFKFEPIRWRVSKYGVSASERPSGFENFASYKTSFSVTSDLILGFGAMKLELDTREGDCVRDFEGFTSVENAINGCSFNFGYCLSTVNFGIDSYSNSSSGQNNAVTSGVLSYNSSMRLASLSGLVAGGRVARASNMVAMLMGSDDTNVSYWTRDLSNLNSGIAITPTGTVVRPWLNHALGMRFSYTFTEGSNAGGGILINGQNENVRPYLTNSMNLSFDKTSNTYTLTTLENSNDPYYVVANHYCNFEAGQTYLISAKVKTASGENAMVSLHFGTGPWYDKGSVVLEGSNAFAYYTATESGSFYIDLEAEGEFGHTAGAVIKVEDLFIYKI